MIKQGKLRRKKTKKTQRKQFEVQAYYMSDFKQTAKFDGRT